MFNEKTVIVTGGASGIGKEVATRFAELGANVLINGRDADKLTQVASAIGATALAGDIGKAETATQLVEKAENLYGGVDILIGSVYKSYALT